MNIARPAIAGAAAIAIAAGGWYAVSPSEEATTISAAQSVEETSISEATTTSSSKTTTTTTKVEETTVVEVVEEDSTEPTLDDATPLADEGTPAATEDTSNLVSELTAAPLKPNNKKPQRWFTLIDNITGAKKLNVKSTAMGIDIPVAVIPAKEQPAPTVYLLNGAGGSEQDTDWIAQAWDVVNDVFKDRSVNVVIPMKGAFSYYIDWLYEPDTPYLQGKQLWSTFLGSELPDAIEPYLGANDKRAVVGFSMSATSALLLAEHNPGKYAAVGSFSGCAATSTGIPNGWVNLTVNRGGAKPEEMWGRAGSEYNRHNDALVNAEKLKGTKLYISSATGLFAESDTVGFLRKTRNMDFIQASANAQTLIIEGGVIEAAMNACTHDLLVKLKANDIPYNANLRATGTHSWRIWKEDLELAWKQTIKPALEL
ncbi:hypothetical protein BJP08_10470 [Corynebacterium sp. NML140438]|uniref:alpha/beta hydrolase n=1 Tax=Corynebacterium sp. NML140438 TaxID=1906334 RepID=UPI0008FB258C|nr:alpha/beta hydrolase family protein [Corynebacterium sp. NML140438]OIR40886.1 hypothetical protein BJP08_10470 [Corynebacterium sp. NML140438]